VPLDLICELLSFDRCEVFFNFMYDSLNRWVTHPDPKIHAHLKDLFGTDEYQRADGMTPAARKVFLHDLYASQLRQAGNFKYVHRFEMINKQAHTIYSLFYGTRSITGLKVMKQAMWSVDPGGGLRFSDRTAGDAVLFDQAPDFTVLRNQLVARFRGQEFSIEEVEEFVLAYTAFGPSHFKKQVLAPLQREGFLEPVSGQRKKGTFPDGVRMRLNSNAR